MALDGLGAFERDAFEDALRAEEEPGHWRKILIHSLALRRDLYLRMGGLPPEYGDFAPWPLAIALHSGGEHLVFSPRPRVHHIYDGNLDQLSSYARSFGRGEMRYRSEVTTEVAARYLDPAVEWEQRLGHTRAGARRALRAAVALRGRGILREVLRYAATAVIGPRLSIARAWAGAALAGRRACRGDDEVARRSFTEFWRLTSSRGRLEGLAEAELGEAPARAAARRFDLTESLAGRAMGFFHLEPDGRGGSIRWIAPLATLKVDVPGHGVARARLELLPLERPEDAPPAAPRIAVDDRAVPASLREDTIEFEVSAGVHWISIACRPLRPRRFAVEDPRDLGVPVRELTFDPT